ncbi:aspartate--tRNA ligase [Candidatus Woesearchaeota archaeon]|nr:MAG: aspartate--tRNA ligase [Candidatus Woesearchaeota archaeon]
MMRTHNCGELTEKDIGKEVTLCGWADTRRDHGGVIFIDLRDRYGTSQIVLDPSHNEQAHKRGEHIGREWVLKVTGHVRKRPEGMENPKMPTGKIEIIADTLTILNQSEVPPFEIDDRIQVSEELRLKYRYLDLRKPEMQKHLLLRHRAAQAAREYLSKNGFLEIETPILVKTTPGGARVYKVPSRTHPGKFYSLPESPQIYKQLLMVAGCDRYFQLARCLRDEDLRSDRQPEFTQIDLEMSFADQEDVLEQVENCIAHIAKETIGLEVKTPFKRLSWREAMVKYGSDKPDLRFGLELKDVTETVKHSNFSIFTSQIDKGGKVFCLNAKGAASFSRKDIEALIDLAKRHGLSGLAWMRVTDSGALESNIVKYFPEAVQAKLTIETDAKPGDLLLFSAGEFETAAQGLGQVRLEVGEKLNLIDENKFEFCTITDFPLFEWNSDESRWDARHHIFTHPKDEDMGKLKEDPGAVHGKLYDVVLNGWELGSGSIRIHRKDIQTQVLEVIGMSYERAEKTFDFLLEAFKYGAPPHGGFAIGFDRLVTMLGKHKDIREYIAFPRNKAQENPMDSSPQPWTEEFLKELHIKLDIVKKPGNPR